MDEQTDAKEFGRVATSIIHDEIDESARKAVEGAEIRGAMEMGLNRKSRRNLESEMMRKERVG